MENVLTWIGNIILPAVAIGISILLSRKTSKDVTRQVESIKQLAENQIDLMRMQLDAEIQKNRLLAKQAYAEWQEMKDRKSVV